MTSGTNYGSSSRPSDSNKVSYNVPAANVITQLQSGAEFILITQTRQGEQPQVWSSGDPEGTRDMFRNVRSVVDTLQPTS